MNFQITSEMHPIGLGYQLYYPADIVSLCHPQRWIEVDLRSLFSSVFSTNKNKLTGENNAGRGISKPHEYVQLFIGPSKNKCRLSRCFLVVCLSRTGETDVDECAVDNGGCEGTCVNRQGSYQCFCSSGFRLASNGKKCIGTYITRG